MRNKHIKYSIWKAFTLFCREFENVVNHAFLVLIFLGGKLVGANFYAFCNYDLGLISSHIFTWWFRLAVGPVKSWTEGKRLLLIQGKIWAKWKSGPSENVDQVKIGSKWNCGPSEKYHLSASAMRVPPPSAPDISSPIRFHSRSWPTSFAPNESWTPNLFSHSLKKQTATT